MKWFTSQMRLLNGGCGQWGILPGKRDFPHSEPTFTSNFAVSTAQILCKNKELNIIIYSEFHVIL